MRELKKCPFCGSEAKSGDGFMPMESIVYAYCTNIDCELHYISVGFTPETWNRRPPAVSAEPELYKRGYTDALHHAAFYVRDHCLSGETHAEIIQELKPENGCMNGACRHRSDCGIHCSDDRRPCDCGVNEIKRGDINRFCDANCSAHRHHPKCAYATPPTSEQARDAVMQLAIQTVENPPDLVAFPNLPEADLQYYKRGFNFAKRIARDDLIRLREKLAKEAKP